MEASWISSSQASHVLEISIIPTILLNYKGNELKIKYTVKYAQLKLDILYFYLSSACYFLLLLAHLITVSQPP